MSYRSLLLSGLLAATTLSGGLVFEDFCTSTEAWDLLDMVGDAVLYPASDPSCPPEYGPSVLRVEGKVVLIMPKGVTLGDGTLVALYRENAPRKDDADGVLLFGADYPMDLRVAHNVKEERRHLWLEQDNDAGFQFRVRDAEGEESVLAERAGVGIVTDTWNRTGWIWQKVTIENGQVRAKYWPAQVAEPADWAIEAPYSEPAGRCGIKINSGNIHLGYFAVDTQDIPVKTPTALLSFPYARVADASNLALTLFTNANQDMSGAYRIEVDSGGKSLAAKQLELTIPAGHHEMPLHLVSPGVDAPADAGDAPVIALSAVPGAGSCRVAMAAENGSVTTEVVLEVLPTAQLQEDFQRTEEILDRLSAAVAKEEGALYPEGPCCVAALRVIDDAARAHLARARELFQAGETESAEMSLRFARGALNELNGYKGSTLRRVAPDFPFDRLPARAEDRRGIGTPKHGVYDYYSSLSLLSFGEPKMEADSFVMGNAYDVTIPWRVEAETPAEDFAFEFRLVSPLGNRVVAQWTQAPETPTGSWTPGRAYEQRVVLDVMPEDFSASDEPPAKPPVLDEYHRLLVTVTDPETGARVFLGNAPGPQAERMGHSFLVADVYVSSSPFELRGFDAVGSKVNKPRTDHVRVGNIGAETGDVDVLFTVETDTERIIFQQKASLHLSAGAEAPVAFSWTPTTAGDMTFHLRVMHNGIVLTEAQRTVTLGPPEGQVVRIVKANHVQRQGNAFVVPVTVDGGTGSLRAEVRAQGRVVGKAQGNSGSVCVDAEPWFGYYDISADFGTFAYERRVVATVVETDGTDLLVNGEPFIVKGVNVHSLDSSSPERTASMMRVMRDLGFNTWRGDYPSRWQMDLAYDLNTVYTVLGPFSCASTAQIFGRQIGPPMATARELSRLFVERYRDSAGVLLWNSCNEIGGENADFLLSLYPVHHAYDPYDRPVHYANLYGQDLYQGQDVMGINTYFGFNQTAASRHPLVQRSLDVARSHGLPLMYCEYNAYIGAVHSSGVDAMEGLFAWGVEQGMCGGVQYMRGNSSSHPGIMDAGYNTHKIYDEAIIDALADAEVAVLGSANGALSLRVTNRRRCTLRQVTVACSVSGVALPDVDVRDLSPEERIEVEVPLPDSLPGPVLTAEGNVEFVTHFGFECTVPFRAIVP